MAIVISSTTTMNWKVDWGSAPSSQTLSVARASGEGLVIGIFYEAEFSSVHAVSSVVWDSVGDNQAMSHVQTQRSDVNDRWLAVYELAAPTTAKTANITVTFDGTNNNIGAMICRHITGHDTAAFVRASAKAGGGSLNPNVTVSSAADDLVIDFLFQRDDPSVLSADSPQGGEVEVQSDAIARTTGSSTDAGASPSVNMAWTNTNAPVDYAIIALSVQPAASVVSALSLYQAPRPLLRL